jgi:hypothetical protein
MNARADVGFGAKRTCIGRHDWRDWSRMTHMRHGVLFVFGACKIGPVAGQEHDRTIPLAVIGKALPKDQRAPRIIIFCHASVCEPRLGS